MSRISPKTTADRFAHTRDNCHPNIYGDMELLSDNLFKGWRFDDLNDDNNPEGLEVGMPEDPEGYYVYLSEKNKGPDTLGAQNTIHVDIDEDFYTLEEPPVTGHAPASPTSASKLIAPPRAPDIKTVARTKTGFKAATYLLAYTWVAKHDKHTLLSPYISVIVGNGQFIRVTLPSSPPEGALKIGLWLSKPNKSYSTMRLQKQVDIRHTRPVSFLMKGPWKSGRKPPTKNETIKKPPKEPTTQKIPGDRVGKSGTYSSRQAGYDSLTGRESMPSDYSGSTTLSQDEADNGGNIRLNNSAGSSSGQYRIYVNVNGEERVYTNRNEGSAAQPLDSSRSRTPTTSGAFDEEASSDEAGVLSSTSTAGTPRTTEDTGIDDPTAPLDNAVAEGPIYIEAGDYWISISYWVRGEETVIAAPQQKNITSTQVFRVYFPSPVDYFKNSQWIDLDNDDKPDSWVLNNVAGTSTEGTWNIDDEGALILSTNGVRTPASGHLTPELMQTVDISRDSFYTLSGTLSSNITAGSAEVVLEELNSGGSVINTVAVKSITSSGVIEFEKRIGRRQSTTFTDGARSVRFVIRMLGTSRNMTLSIQELAFSPHEGRLRRRHRPHKGDRKHSDTNPPPHHRHHKKHHHGVELPPVKSRTPPAVAPLGTADFEDGALPPSAWTLQNTGSAGTFVVENLLFPGPPPKIEGTRTFHINKTDYNTREAYIHKDFGPNRDRLGLHFKMRVTNKITWDSTVVASIRHSQSSTPGYTTTVGSLAWIVLYYNSRKGYIEAYLGGLGDYWKYLGGGINNGDLLDIEFLVRGAGTSQGYLNGALGVNGVQRTFITEWSGWDFSGLYANVAQVGHMTYEPSVTFDHHFDSVVVTELGDQIANPGVPQTNDPLILPDRPYASPTYTDTVSFEAGSVPSPWSITTSGGTGQAASVIAGAAIDGSFGFRSVDAGSSIATFGYISRTVTARNDCGLKARMRITTRPTTGSITLLTLNTSSGQTMGRLMLDSAGVVYSQAVNASNTNLTQRQIASGITNGTILTAELVAHGGNTGTGILEAWLEVGGTSGGAIASRQLMSQETSINWASTQIAQTRVGISTESAAAAQYSVDFDTLAVTDRGEAQLSEYDLQGNSIYQIDAWYQPNQPVRDDLFLKGLRVAVEPGVQYTFAIKARHSGLDNTAYPYYFTAYDTGGVVYPLGSLYGPSGATGTSAWADRAQTWTIPEDCYEVRMDSRQIGQGEFICQELSATVGTSAKREVIYPATGTFQFSVDSRTPEQYLAPRPKNIWLRKDGLINTPFGTSGSTLYGSGDTNFAPDYWTDDPTIVEQKRFAHFQVTLNASTDFYSSPIVLSNSPGLEVYTRNGDTQVAVLLRGDLSEFPGGVFLDKVAFNKFISEWDQWTPKGHIRRHRRWAPVGAMKGFTINAFTKEAMREIEETCMSEEFVVEARDERIRAKFSAPVEFETKGATARKHPATGKWHMWGTANTEKLEVIEVGRVPTL